MDQRKSTSDRRRGKSGRTGSCGTMNKTDQWVISHVSEIERDYSSGGLDFIGVGYTAPLRNDLIDSVETIARPQGFVNCKVRMKRSLTNHNQLFRISIPL